MSAWLKRFSLHLAAALGATSIFVAAAAVGATQTRHQTAAITSGPAATAGARRTASVVPGPTSQLAVTPSAPTALSPAAPTALPAASTSALAPATNKVVPERSLAGSVVNVLPDGLDVLGVGGREWRVAPAPGALIRLNGKTAPLDAVLVGDKVVILGQAQARQGSLYRFLAHAITARRK